MTSGPYLPDHGERPTEVTVTSDAEVIVVAGVRLLADDALALGRRIVDLAKRVEHEQQAARLAAVQAEELRRWMAGAVVTAPAMDGEVRLRSDGSIDGWQRRTLYHVEDAAQALLAAAPGRRLWWHTDGGAWHVDGCGCWHTGGASTVRLMPVDWRPSDGPCKRSQRKLAAEGGR